MRAPAIAHPVLVLPEIGSTNAEAMRLASRGERGPLWIRAERQTAGKGRSGRVWTSERGNLYASFLTTLDCPPQAVAQLSLVAGVAVVEAIRAASGGRPPAGLTLKWPNDVLIGDAKCVGILPEAMRDPHSGATAVVIGIGVNLAHHPDLPGRRATHLAHEGIAVTPEEMLGYLSAALDSMWSVWDLGAGFAQILNRWRVGGTRPGQPLTVTTHEKVFYGSFVDLDPDGALRLRDDKGYEHKVTYGDVTLTPEIKGS